MRDTLAQLEVSRPRKYSIGAILVTYAWSLFLILPIFASLMGVSLMRLGMLTLIIPITMLALSAWFLPFGQGNVYIRKLVESLGTSAEPGKSAFFVQLTLHPRIRSGLRAFIEDADDVGALSFGETELIYSGDAVKLSLPYSNIRQIALHNVGLRGLFVSGRRIELAVTGLGTTQFLEIAERSALLLPTSKQITRDLYKQLAAKVR